MRSLAVVVAACISCTPTWRHAARVTEAAAVVSVACDGGSTQQYLAESTWIETNPILGQHPSSAYLWTYLAVASAVIVTGNRLVSDRMAVLINGAVVLLEVDNVLFNMSFGSSACGLGTGGPWKPSETAR